LEVWDRDIWDKYRKDVMANLPSIVEGVEWDQ